MILFLFSRGTVSNFLFVLFHLLEPNLRYKFEDLVCSTVHLGKLFFCHQVHRARLDLRDLLDLRALEDVVQVQFSISLNDSNHS